MRYLSGRVMVVHLGHVVDVGRAAEAFLPPYTEALLWAVPLAGPKVTHKRIEPQGDVAATANPSPACPLQTRCCWKTGGADEL